MLSDSQCDPQSHPWWGFLLPFCNSASYDFHACNHLSRLPSWLSGQESACNAGDTGSIPVSGRFLWRRTWQPTPVFLPGDPMDRGAWWLQRVKHDWATNTFTFTFHLPQPDFGSQRLSELHLVLPVQRAGTVPHTAALNTFISQHWSSGRSFLSIKKTSKLSPWKQFRNLDLFLHLALSTIKF